jgi:hypothetical protein
MKGSKNLSHSNRVRHVTLRRHVLGNVVNFRLLMKGRNKSVTQEPGMTCDIEETFEESTRDVQVISTLNKKKNNKCCRTYN